MFYNSPVSFFHLGSLWVAIEIFISTASSIVWKKSITSSIGSNNFREIVVIYTQKVPQVGTFCIGYLPQCILYVQEKKKKLFNFKILFESK